MRHLSLKMEPMILDNKIKIQFRTIAKTTRKKQKTSTTTPNSLIFKTKSILHAIELDRHKAALVALVHTGRASVFIVNRDAVSLGHGPSILVVQAFFFENSIDPVCVMAAGLREIISVTMFTRGQ